MADISGNKYVVDLLGGRKAIESARKQARRRASRRAIEALRMEMEVDEMLDAIEAERERERQVGPDALFINTSSAFIVGKAML